MTVNHSTLIAFACLACLMIGAGIHAAYNPTRMETVECSLDCLGRITPEQALKHPAVDAVLDEAVREIREMSAVIDSLMADNTLMRLQMANNAALLPIPKPRPINLD